MSWMLMRNKGPVFAADGEGGGAAPAADAPAPAAPSDTNSVLYPDDKPAAPVDATPPAPAEDAPAWAEFVPDPAKSDDENAAAKAEHDAKKPAEADGAKGDEVPADGRYTFTMPEGVELDGELAAAIGPELAAAKVTQADAQKLVDKFIATQQARAAKQAEDWSKTTSEWVDQAKADPEIGGAKWDKTVSSASGLVKRFGNDGLRDYLNASGAGNHPEMIRFMAKVGALIGEDDPAHAEAPGKKFAKDVVSELYPNDKPKGK